MTHVLDVDKVDAQQIDVREPRLLVRTTQRAKEREAAFPGFVITLCWAEVLTGVGENRVAVSVYIL